MVFFFSFKSIADYMRRERWPKEPILGHLESFGMREAFVAKQVELLKLKFKDPLTVDLDGDEIEKGFEHILLDSDNLFLSQVFNLSYIMFNHGPMFISRLLLVL